MKDSNKTTRVAIDAEHVLFDDELELEEHTVHGLTVALEGKKAVIPGRWLEGSIVLAGQLAEPLAGVDTLRVDIPLSDLGEKAHRSRAFMRGARVINVGWSTYSNPCHWALPPGKKRGEASRMRELEELLEFAVRLERQGLERFAELRGRILVCVASRAYHIDMLVAVANAAAPGEELGVWVARWRENLEAMRAKISTRGAQLAMF